jgi:hypothetical protein
MHAMQEKDKRKGPRKAITGILEFYDQEGLLITGLGRVLNLSIAGALIETAMKLKAGQPLHLRLRLPGKTPTDLNARVVRSFGKGPILAFGIQFLDLTPLQSRRIQGAL